MILISRKYECCQSTPMNQFHSLGGCLFKAIIYVFHDVPLRLVIIQENHDRGLVGYFDKDKTFSIVRKNFYWPKLACDMERHIRQCKTYYLAKTKGQNIGLYLPLPILDSSWVDVSINFILSLPRIQGQNDSMMVVVNKLFKMAHLIPCHKTLDAFHIVDLYFKKVIRLHAIPKTITSYRDVKYLSHFWKALWSKLGTKLQFGFAAHPHTI